MPWYHTYLVPKGAITNYGFIVAYEASFGQEAGFIWNAEKHIEERE